MVIVAKRISGTNDYQDFWDLFPKFLRLLEINFPEFATDTKTYF